jgi:hypothetical protein
MGPRDKLRRLEAAARGHLASFELVDDSRFYYERQSGEVFLHICECLRNHDKPERPEPPEIVKALARARDRQAAYSEVFGTYRDMLPYDEQALVERGEVVPISLVVGRELGEPLPDLSE